MASLQRVFFCTSVSKNEILKIICKTFPAILHLKVRYLLRTGFLYYTHLSTTEEHVTKSSLKGTTENAEKILFLRYLNIDNEEVIHHF